MTIFNPDDLDLQEALRYYATPAMIEEFGPQFICELMRHAADCIDELEERR